VSYRPLILLVASVAAVRRERRASARELLAAFAQLEERVEEQERRALELAASVDRHEAESRARTAHLEGRLARLEEAQTTTAGRVDEERDRRRRSLARFEVAVAGCVAEVTSLAQILEPAAPDGESDRLAEVDL
jgi:hypothetical protein